MTTQTSASHHLTPQQEKTDFLLRSGFFYRHINQSELPPEDLRNGTLCYDLPGLIVTCAFLLLGGFGFGMLLNAFYVILPLQLKSSGASNMMIGLLITTLPSMLTTVSNPVFSTWSDRTRSKWGRRRPFLLFSAPLLAVCMLGLGWAPEIVHVFGSTSSTAVIWMLGISSVLWNVVLMVPNTVLWYIFPDTVPKKYIGRYMAFFNVISQAAGFAFNYWLLQYAESATGWVYTLIAVFYMISMLLLVLMVKEGEYPSVSPAPRNRNNIIGKVNTYIQECYSIPFYYWFFTAMALSEVSLIGRTMYNVLYARDSLQIPIEEIGKITSLSNVIGLIISVPLAWCSDKIHPMRFFMLSLATVIGVNIFGFFYVSDAQSFLVITIMLIVVYTMQTVSTIPVFVEILPKAQYGQFSSANALFKAIFLSISGLGGGWVFDKLGDYQYIYAWDFLFTLAALACFVVLYRKYQQMGGFKSYVAPVRCVTDKQLQ